MGAPGLEISFTSLHAKDNSGISLASLFFVYTVCSDVDRSRFDPTTLEYELVPPVSTEKREPSQVWYNLTKETFYISLYT